MFQYIENLRKKPEPERRKAVFLVSLYITLFIAIVWAIVTSIRVSETDFSFDTSEIDKKVPTLGESFSNFADRMGQVFGPSATTTGTDTRSN